MSGSQRLSSALCIGVLYSTANGFVPTIPLPAMIESQHTTIARRDARSQIASGTTNLHATKGRSSAPTTAIASSSDKVKEMASFLSYQILEKVMADAMKPEGERTMDLEAVERITQALQTTSPTSDLPPDVTMTTIPPESTSDSESADDGATVTTTKEPEATLDPIASATTAIPETTPEDSTAAPESETTESNKVESGATAVEEEKPVAPAPAAATEVPEPVWTPLEVVQSNIPPLRPESIPKRTNPAPVEEETETIQDEVVAETPAEEEAPEDISDQEPPSEDIVAEEPDIVDESPEDEALILESKKAQESFQRRLLQQKLEYDMKAASQIESQDDSEPSTPVEDAEETTEKDEDTTKGESTAMNEIVSDPCESSESESPAELTTQRSSSSSSSSSSSPPVISQRRVETILARRQPKSTDEESILTEKYAEMENLEDRAYALLVDLGMIDEHKDPKDPSYDHSDDDDLCEQRYFPRM